MGNYFLHCFSLSGLVYLIKKEKIKANAVFFYALMGLLINVIFYMIFGR